MNEKTKFYIELPQDEFGNRAVTNSVPCIVEAIEREDGGLLFVAPPSVAKHGGCAAFFKSGWLECYGPAREISEGEREAIIVQILSKPVAPIDRMAIELSKIHAILKLRVILENPGVTISE